MGVRVIKNDAYMERNNHSSIYAARAVLGNTYICSGDNYFCDNPFEKEVDDSCYAAVYADGETKEWCMETDSDGSITQVNVGGKNAWYMLGHAFWSEKFSERFLRFLEAEYEDPRTKGLFWENIFMNHLDVLKMKMRKYPTDFIFEFDSIDELREFDRTYIADTRSSILKAIAAQLEGTESEITHIEPLKNTSTEVVGIRFTFRAEQYSYSYYDHLLRRI